MKKAISAVMFLAVFAVMSAGSAFATCGSPGDGCTTPPPTPTNSCVGNCGGTTWANGQMNVMQIGGASAYGKEAQAFSVGTHDLTAQFTNNVGGVTQLTGAINMAGGFQGSANGSSQPGVVKAGGSAWGSSKWNYVNSFGSSPLSQPIVAPTTWATTPQ
jgi:hypothetical protein